MGHGVFSYFQFNARKMVSLWILIANYFFLLFILQVSNLYITFIQEYTIGIGEEKSFMKY